MYKIKHSYLHYCCHAFTLACCQLQKTLAWVSQSSTLRWGTSMQYWGTKWYSVNQAGWSFAHRYLVPNDVVLLQFWRATAQMGLASSSHSTGCTFEIYHIECSIQIYPLGVDVGSEGSKGLLHSTFLFPKQGVWSRHCQVGAPIQN